MRSSPTSGRRWATTALGWALAAAFALSACSDDPLSSLNNSNPDGGTRRCQRDEDCPDRFGCNVSVGICFPFDECGPDDPCPEDNQVCEAGDDGFRVCVFERCDDATDCAGISCASGEVPTCVAGGCVCGPPCGGACPSGQGCCVVTQTCEVVPPACAQVTCAPGTFLSVTSEGAWSQGQCERTGDVCGCEPLPPLPEGDIGQFSSLAHTAFTPVISAYNRTYGDLMVGIEGTDGRIAWTFVDGVPTTTTSVTGGLNGPRGGNSDPGANVGQHTDVAVDPSDRVHVSYYDVDRTALKYAVLPGGNWQNHTVDGDGMGTTGLYSSIAIAATNRPAIAYLGAREGRDNGARRSLLKLAIATTDTPATRADWTVRTIDSFDISGLGCDDRCNDDEVCRASDQRCIVPDPIRACGSCNAQQACIERACTSIIPAPVVRTPPRARGLWPSLAFASDGSALVAYRDEVDRRLVLARIEGPDIATGAITRQVLEGAGGPLPTDDTGHFPSLFVASGGEVHVAYMNQSRQALRYTRLTPTLTIAQQEDVDNGLSAPGPDGLLLGGRCGDGGARVTGFIGPHCLSRCHQRRPSICIPDRQRPVDRRGHRRQRNPLYRLVRLLRRPDGRPRHPDRGRFNIPILFVRP